MTTKELIEMLSELPPDTLVVLSSDSEGNSYGVCHNVALVNYRQEGWQGVIVEKDEEPEDGDVSAVVFWS